MLAALAGGGLATGPCLKALAAHAGALSLLSSHLPTTAGVSVVSDSNPRRAMSSNGRHSSVYITDVDNNPTSHMPLLLGLVNYFERHMPYGEASERLVCVPSHWCRGAKPTWQLCVQQAE